ncbi:MAG: low temperature requirement protein A, partial [Gaiellales bacterium]
SATRSDPRPPEVGCCSGHDAERHGLILLIALGESIVEIGAGSRDVVDTGVVVAAIVSVAVTAELWWLYFDVVALVAARRLAHATPGHEQNAIARDSFSYLHLPMVAGIILVALGFEETLRDVSAHLHRIPAVALLGGTAMYLLAHVAFRWRNVHRFTYARLVVAIVCVLLIPVAVHVPALVTLSALALLLLSLILFERRRWAELRQRLRHQLVATPAP